MSTGTCTLWPPRPVHSGLSAVSQAVRSARRVARVSLDAGTRCGNAQSPRELYGGRSTRRETRAKSRRQSQENEAAARQSEHSYCNFSVISFRSGLFEQRPTVSMKHSFQYTDSMFSLKIERIFLIMITVVWVLGVFHLSSLTLWLLEKTTFRCKIIMIWF